MNSNRTFLWSGGVAAALVVGFGAGAAVGHNDPTKSQQYKSLSSQVTKDQQRVSDGEAALSLTQTQLGIAKAKVTKIQGNLPERETQLKLGEAQLKQDQAAVAARERSVTRREKAVGIVEKTIAANTIPGDGVYRVGVDMKAGTYKTSGATDCYYALLNSSDTNDIASNNITSGQAFVTVYAGKYFETDSCADWVLQQ